MTAQVNILIVDDTLLARAMLRKFVSKAKPNWQLLEAKDGSDALLKVDGKSSDVALIDYNMPGMTGLDLGRRLREKFPNIIMALVTANIQDYIADEARSLGIAFISKPVDEEKIVKFISGLEA